MTGNNLPRSLDLVAKLAEVCAAEDVESRLLLAWASAIIAFDAGETLVGQHFVTMFRPLYAEHALVAQKMISVPNAAMNILLDLGVPRKLATQVAEELSGCNSAQEAVGHILFHEDEQIRKAVRAISPDQMISASKMYCEL